MRYALLDFFLRCDRIGQPSARVQLFIGPPTAPVVPPGLGGFTHRYHHLRPRPPLPA